MLLFQRLIALTQDVGCDVDVETAFLYKLWAMYFPTSSSENNGYLQVADKRVWYQGV